MDTRETSVPSEADSNLRPRSPELLSNAHSGLLVVDIQEKLLPAIHQADTIQWNVARLLDGANALGVSVLATEQYPEKLGPTVSALRDRIPQTLSKRMFSCRECFPLPWGTDASQKREQLIICGIEAHVCVLQTVLDCIDFQEVYVVADAIGSRFPTDEKTAIRRMSNAGAKLVTTESVLFEWAETSLHPEFKFISSLVRQSPPR